MGPWFNTDLYTVPQLLVFVTGCGLWALLYLILIRNFLRDRFVEMPIVAAASNFGWEFLWAFVFKTDMGLLMNLGYKLWFFLDVFIFAAVLRYGKDQVHIPELRRHFRASMLLILLAFGIGYYFFTAEGFDTPTGLTSGLIANVVISGLYPLMMLRKPSLAGISTAIAWLKMLGTGLITLFAFMYFQEGAWFIKSLGLAVLALDLYYLYLLYERIGREGRSAASA